MVRSFSISLTRSPRTRRKCEASRSVPARLGMNLSPLTGVLVPRAGVTFSFLLGELRDLEGVRRIVSRSFFSPAPGAFSEKLPKRDIEPLRLAEPAMNEQR